MLSAHETEKMKDIEQWLVAMRAHLAKDVPPLEDSTAWFQYLTELKAIQGNANNNVSFVATILAKEYLLTRYGVKGFDAAEKPQGAPGIDIDVHLPDGRRLIAELKTTNPYLENDFGAMQKKMIKKDFAKLSKTEADIKLFLVTDAETFRFMQKSKYQTTVTGITIVLLTTGEEFTG
jgi:hypothetical protein